MLPKNIFIEVIEVIEKQYKHDESFSKQLVKVTKNGVKTPMSNAAELYNFLIQNNV